MNGEAYVDPRLDTSTPAIRDIFSRTAHDRDSFEILTVNIAPQSEEGIRTVVRNLIETSSVDWIVVVGGIGFEESDYTPEMSVQSNKSTKHHPSVPKRKLHLSRQ